MITNELGLSGGERRKQNRLAPLKPSPPSEPRLNVFFPAYGSRGEKWQCYLYFLLRQSSLISAGFISCLINLYTWEQHILKGPGRENISSCKTFQTKFSSGQANQGDCGGKIFFGCLSKVNFFLPWIIFLWVGNEMSDTSDRRSVNSCKWNILYT